LRWRFKTTFILALLVLTVACTNNNGPQPTTSTPAATSTTTSTLALAPVPDALQSITDEPVSQIVSDDNQATLSIPEGALPEGTKLEDISITRLDGEDLHESVYSVYELKPDGVTFEKPVTVSITVTAREGDIPLFFSHDGNSVEFIDTTEVILDKSANTVSVTAPIAHFSDVGMTEGLFRAVIPETLGEYKVGEEFEVTIVVFYKEKVTFYYWGINDTIFVVGEPEIKVDWRGWPVVPAEVWGSPPRGKFKNTFSWREIFKCFTPGEGAIDPKIRIRYNFRLNSPPDDSTPGPVFFNEPTINLREPFKCLETKAEEYGLYNSPSVLMMWPLAPEPNVPYPRVPIYTYIRLEFSEEMDKDTVEEAFTLDPPVVGEIIWSDSEFGKNSIMTFYPKVDLEYNTVYKMLISKEAKDLAGNNLVYYHGGAIKSELPHLGSFETVQPPPNTAFTIEGCPEGVYSKTDENGNPIQTNIEIDTGSTTKTGDCLSATTTVNVVETSDPKKGYFQEFVCENIGARDPLSKAAQYKRTDVFKKWNNGELVEDVTNTRIYGNLCDTVINTPGGHVPFINIPGCDPTLASKNNVQKKSIKLFCPGLFHEAYNIPGNTNSERSIYVRKMRALGDYEMVDWTCNQEKDLEREWGWAAWCGPKCGNGIVDAGEGCDPSSSTGENNCLDPKSLILPVSYQGDKTSVCHPASCSCIYPDECGNGVLEVGEECDDGLKLSGDGCSSDCKIEDMWK
jgi:cysteine-rich repeat protein